MPILKKGHYYVNKKKKSMYIKEILPHKDLEVSFAIYIEYEDKTRNLKKERGRS